MFLVSSFWALLSCLLFFHSGYTLSRLLFLRFPSSSLLLFLLPGSTVFCPPSLFLLFGHGLVLLCTIIAPWTSAPSSLLFWSTAFLLLL